MSVDFNTLARQFCEFYYNKFDTDRNQLGNLYRDHSMLTFEQSQVQGAKNIVEKLASMSFQRVEHSITTLDAQPASPSGDAVIVMVTGQLKMDDDPPKGFAQVFHLLSDGPGSYYVFNDIFRLQF